MHICIDSCVFIKGLQENTSVCGRLLDLIGPDLAATIPRLVAQEVTRNLETPDQVRRFYRLFHQRDISDNRHFLRDLHTDAFDVLEAAEFIERWETDAL